MKTVLCNKLFGCSCIICLKTTAPIILIRVSGRQNVLILFHFNICPKCEKYVSDIQRGSVTEYRFYVDHVVFGKQ